MNQGLVVPGGDAIPVTASSIEGLPALLSQSLNVKDFDASGSDEETTGSISASSSALTLADALDFEDGQGIAVFGAGPEATVQQPTGVGTSNVGSAGVTSQTYRIASIDAFGGVGAATAGVTINTANASPSVNNYVNVSWTAPAAGTAPKAYVIYKDGAFAGIAANTTNFNDQGIVRSRPSWCPTTPPEAPTSSILVTSVVSGGGTTSLVLADEASTAASGAVVQHDDTVALSAAFNAAMGVKRLTIPDGTYLVSSSIFLTASGDVDVLCSRNAILKSASNLGDQIFGMTDGVSRDRYGLSWRGGQFNNSGGMFGIAVASNSCVGTTRIGNMLFDGVIFQGAATLSAASVSTDSGIAFVDAKNVTITNCIFSGQGDLGIYGSGGGLQGGGDDGGSIIVTNNQFVNCGVGVSMKRQLPRSIISNNTFDGCFVGIALLEASSGPAIDPGRQAIISNNIIRKTMAVGICLHEGAADTEDGSGTGLVRQSRTQIIGNKILDFGYLSDGTTAYGGSTAFGSTIAAIVIQGASQCRISHNLIALEDWTQGGNGSANHKGIYVTEFTLNSVLYNTDSVIIDNCDFINVKNGIYGDAAGNGPIVALGCTYRNVTTKATFANSSSINEEIDTANGIRGTVGSSEVWRFSSAGIFSTRFRTFLDSVGYTKINRTSATLDFASVSANSTKDLTVTISGMTVANGFAKVTPQASNLMPTGISYFAWVSAANTVTVRAINSTTGAIVLPSGSFVVNGTQVS